MTNTDFYDFLKTKYHKVVPIRGRSPEVRPIASRRKLRETVQQIDLGGGQYAYAARLYDTDCLTAYPDGTIAVATGGFHTSSTARFISSFGVFNRMCIRSAKLHNRIWVWGFGNRKGRTKYPLGNTPVRFRLEATADGGFDMQLAEPMSVRVERVDRKAASHYHQRVKPFLDWVQAFLAMSDGWLMHETVKTVLSLHRTSSGELTGKYTCGKDSSMAFQPLLMLAENNFGRNSVTMRESFELLMNLREEDYLSALATLAQRWSRANHLNDDRYRLAESAERRLGNTTWPVRFFDMQLEFANVKRLVYEVISSQPEARKIITLEPDSKFRALA